MTVGIKIAPHDNKTLMSILIWFLLFLVALIPMTIFTVNAHEDGCYDCGLETGLYDNNLSPF